MRKFTGLTVLGVGVPTIDAAVCVKRGRPITSICLFSYQRLSCAQSRGGKERRSDSAESRALTPTQSKWHNSGSLLLAYISVKLQRFSQIRSSMVLIRLLLTLLSERQNVRRVTAQVGAVVKSRNFTCNFLCKYLAQSNRQEAK